MTMPGETEARLTRLIARIANLDPASVDLDARWRAIGLDSLDLLDLLVSCEHEFALTIDDALAVQLRCGQDLVTFIGAAQPRSEPHA
jgi:acyl carrier protein